MSQNDEPALGSDLSGGFGDLTVSNSVGLAIGASKTRSNVPVFYRLAKKPDGTLVLMGAYQWQEGSRYGHEWGEMPTVEIDA